MSSRGISETEKLKSNLHDQLGRLLAQLTDLEECKCDLEPSDYEETKAETLEQLKEFQTSLGKLQSGNITLVDDVNAIQLAIAAAVSNAFTTPEVISMFHKKQPGELRQRLIQLERDRPAHLHPDVAVAHNRQRAEILMALKKLDDSLTPLELNFLELHSSMLLKEFALVPDDTSSASKICKMAGQHVASQMNHP